MSSLLNTEHTKQFILYKTQRLRPGWDCTRVSKEAIEQIEAKLRVMIIQMVESHPTVGKTFRVS